MKQDDRNACAEAYEQLLLEISNPDEFDECHYWVFERGYRAAVQALLDIADSGVQDRKFASPRLQGLAERLIDVNDCI